MLIPIPTGMNYRAQAWGSAIKEIACVHCGAVFVYEMRRVVTSSASAPLFIGMGGAENRAADGARAALARELALDNDDVPCPSCKKLQPSMNRSKRKMRTAAIVVVWVATLIAAFFGYEVAESQFRPPSAWVRWLPIVSTIAGVAAIIGLRFLTFRGTATDRAQLRSEAEAENCAAGDAALCCRRRLDLGPCDPVSSPLCINAVPQIPPCCMPAASGRHAHGCSLVPGLLQANGDEAHPRGSSRIWNSPRELHVNCHEPERLGRTGPMLRCDGRKPCRRFGAGGNA